MDLIQAINEYIFNMVEAVPGMKILLLDKDTTSYVSTVITQSNLLSKEVYLIDLIDRMDSEKLVHLKCITFLRPNNKSVSNLTQELKNPRFSEYHLNFSNIIKKASLETLAEADENESVKVVKEVFADFIAINSHLFSLNINTKEYQLFNNYNFDQFDSSTLQRSTEGIISVLLTLKKKPLIRYDAYSKLSKTLAEEVQNQIDKENQLFRFPAEDSPPLLLILDRKSDPITPLLMQWTYQAMIHELLTINNGRVDMSSTPDISKDLKEIVLNIQQDPFYNSNLYMNFGDLGANIKKYVDEYQVKTKNQSKIESIADMKRFVEEYPEFRKLAGNVSKHVALVSELSRLVGIFKLLEVSELEQSLACNDQHNVDFKNIIKLIQDKKIGDSYKLKLAMLYCLRYEKSPSLNAQQLFAEMKSNGVSDANLKVIDKVMEYGGYDQRQNDLYGDSNLFSKGRNVIKGLKGVENVYTQHVPLLYHQLEDLVKGKLKEAQFPFIKQSSKLIPQDVIIYQVGGTTYQEAHFVSQFNQQNLGFRVVLGGPDIINSEMFLKMICGDKI
ncbi:Sec1-like protein [Neoconidiobolus thromboides FSU 785]|nr:Sec1-like protein [Neoconidiobolus thromboides FSU 785]